MADKKKTGILGPLVFAGFSFGFTYLVFQIPNGSDQCGSEVMAFTMSQGPVSDALKSSATAEFPSMAAPGVSVERVGDCRFRVSAFVDSENGFGAMIRSNYIADVIHNEESDGWGVTGLSIQ